MQVTPAQSIKIFGLWDQPRQMVSWDNLKKLNLSWRRLRMEFQFSAEQLYKINPDKREWVQRGALTLHDLPEMTMFPVNPFLDLNADLAEVWSMRWSADLLADMGVTYAQMKRRGLNPQFMEHLNYSVGGWYMLKFKNRDLHEQEWTETQCFRVFKTPLDEMRAIFTNFEQVEEEGKGGCQKRHQ